MIEAVRNLHELGVELEDALAAASHGAGAHRGPRRPGEAGRGAPADVVVLDDRLEVAAGAGRGRRACRSLGPEIAEQPEVLERMLGRGGGAMRRCARDRPPPAALRGDRGARLLRQRRALRAAPARPPRPHARRARHAVAAHALRRAAALRRRARARDLAVRRVARHRRRARRGPPAGRVTLAITNDPASPLAEAAGHALVLHAGEERSVAATKTYTASLALLAALVTTIRRPRAPPGAPLMPEAIARQLGTRATTSVDAAAGWERLAVIGRGADYATAFEAALKLKELTRHRGRGGLARPTCCTARSRWSAPASPCSASRRAGPTEAAMRELVDAARARGDDVRGHRQRPAPASCSCGSSTSRSG